MTVFLSIENYSNFISAAFSLLVSLFIIKKDKNSWLNRFLFGTYFLWSLNTLFYSFVYLTDLGLPLLNFIRDCNVTFGISAAFFLFQTGYSVANGAQSALEKKRVIYLITFALILIVVSLLNDQIIYINNGSESMVKTEPIASFTIFLIPGLIALIGVIYFYDAFVEMKDRTMKTRTLLFMIGSSLLIVGAMIFGLEDLIFPEGETPFYLLSQLSWALGPVFIVYGLYGIKEKPIYQ